jgi:hypothetical protein
MEEDCEEMTFCETFGTPSDLDLLVTESREKSCSDTTMFDSAQYRGSMKLIGKLTQEERQDKILRYKEKLKKYRDSHPVKKNFSGRAEVARAKPRENGRFVKKQPELKEIFKIEKISKENQNTTDSCLE